MQRAGEGAPVVPAKAGTSSLPSPSGGLRNRGSPLPLGGPVENPLSLWERVRVRVRRNDAKEQE